MINKRKYLFTKTLLLISAIFLCLPCTAKRQIKESLHIPTAQLPLKQTTPSAICYTSNKEDILTSFRSSTEIKFHPLLLTGTCEYNTSSCIYHPIKNSYAPYLFSQIPIYILYERFLI